MSFKPLLLKDISMRATTFSADNLDRQVLRSGDYFQLQVEASGGRVEWMKDGQIVPKVVQPYCDRAGHLVNVDQPDRTQLLEPGTYPPNRPKHSWNDFVPSEQHFPPNRCQSFFGGRCQVLLTIREGFKKRRKVWPFTQPGGRAPRVIKNQTSFLEKHFFSELVESF